MISFSQLLILLFVGILLFSDTKQLANKLIALFANVKVFIAKVVKKSKK